MVDIILLIIVFQERYIIIKNKFFIFLIRWSIWRYIIIILFYIAKLAIHIFLWQSFILSFYNFPFILCVYFIVLCWFFCWSFSFGWTIIFTLCFGFWFLIATWESLWYFIFEIKEINKEIQSYSVNIQLKRMNFQSTLYSYEFRCFF